MTGSSLAGRRDRAVAVGRLLRGVLARLDQCGHERVDLFQGRRPGRGNGGRLEALVRKILCKGVVVKRGLELAGADGAEAGHLAAVAVVAHVALQFITGRAHAHFHLRGASRLASKSKKKPPTSS